MNTIGHPTRRDDKNSRPPSEAKANAAIIDDINKSTYADLERRMMVVDHATSIQKLLAALYTKTLREAECELVKTGMNRSNQSVMDAIAASADADIALEQEINKNWHILKDIAGVK